MCVCVYASVQFSRSVVSDSLQPDGLQHFRLPCSSPTPGVYPNSSPLSWWCQPTISSSIFPSIRVFSSESALHIKWPKDWTFASASVLPMNIQDWFPLGLAGLISLQSKGLSSVYSITTVWKHQFFHCILSIHLIPPFSTPQWFSVSFWVKIKVFAVV